MGVRNYRGPREKTLLPRLPRRTTRPSTLAGGALPSVPKRPSRLALCSGSFARLRVLLGANNGSVRSGRRPRAAARGTYGRVGRLVVDVDEGTLDAWERLYFVLELLGKVVRLPQRRVRIHDDVELDEVVLFPQPVQSVGCA